MMSSSYVTREDYAKLRIIVWKDEDVLDIIDKSYFYLGFESELDHGVELHISSILECLDGDILEQDGFTPSEPGLYEIICKAEFVYESSETPDGTEYDTEIFLHDMIYNRYRDQDAEDLLKHEEESID